MAILTGADIATWRASVGLIVVDAAPIIGLSRRSIEGIEACNSTLTEADAAKVNDAIARYAALHGR